MSAVSKAEGGFGFGSMLAGPLSPVEALEVAVDAAYQTCERAGLNAVAAGGSRIVVVLDDERVAKIGWNPAIGCRANRNEARLFNAAPVDIREALAPVLDLLDEDVLIQRRVVPLHGMPSDPTELVEQRSKLYAIGVKDALLPKQWGRLDDRLVCVDYSWVNGLARWLPADLERAPRLLSEGGG